MHSLFFFCFKQTISLHACACIPSVQLLAWFCQAHERGFFEDTPVGELLEKCVLLLDSAYFHVFVHHAFLSEESIDDA